MLTALKLSGVGDVNADPRSSDFGKIKIGPTRINFWGTQQLLARSITQLVTGQRIDPELGPMPVDRGDVAVRYFRSGLAPEWAAAWEFGAGENFMGQPTSPSEERGISGEEIAKREAFNRMVPLAWQDIIDAVRTDGLRGGFIAGATGPVGIGVQSYEARAAQELQNIPEFTGGLNQRQINEVEDFLREVDAAKDEWRLNYGRDDISTADAIAYLGAEMGKDENFIAWAERLRYGSKARESLRNPEWIDYIVEHSDKIREDRPDLLKRNYIIDALRERETAGVP